jgi:hypothetical protein
MQFDPALAARAAFHEAEHELGSDWPMAAELEDAFSSNAGRDAADAYEALLTLAQRHPKAHAFEAFCIYITWQQVTEETIARHFETGVRLCERYLAFPEGKPLADLAHIQELHESFKAGLGMEQEDDLQTEFRRDVPKGGD